MVVDGADRFDINQVVTTLYSLLDNVLLRDIVETLLYCQLIRTSFSNL